MKKNNYIKKKILVFSAFYEFNLKFMHYSLPQFICISRKYFLFVVLFQIIFILVLYN